MVLYNNTKCDIHYRDTPSQICFCLMINPALLLSIPLSVGYFLKPGWFIKATPIWSAAVASFLQHHNSYSNTIAIGLFASSFGDIFLELDDDYGLDMFIPGLVSFLIAHLFYIRAFSGKLQSSAMWVAIPIVVVYYLVVMSKLIPKAEPELRIPVLVYGLAISSMAFLSINRFFCNQLNTTSKFLSLLGSLSFVISDTVLAFNKFHTPIDNAKVIVMITYYGGQFCIAASTQYVNESKAK